MEFRTLGRTGLRISAAGLGGGGLSCLGLKQGRTEKEVVSLIHKALDAGINLLDTSERNGTEPVISKALKSHDRGRLILSSKRGVSAGTHRFTPAEISRSIDDCLVSLGTDYIDVFSFHGVLPEEYDYVVDTLLPCLTNARTAGKVRFCGITEVFKWDTSHQMLQKAVMDDCWDVIMVGYSLINFSADEYLFDQVRQRNTGVLGMYAVRNALRGEDTFLAMLKNLVDSRKLRAGIDEEEVLNLLLNENGHRITVTELAYRFCLSNPSIHSVLIGTGNPLHLEENLCAINRSTLSPEKLQVIHSLFSGIDTVSGH